MKPRRGPHKFLPELSVAHHAYDLVVGCEDFRCIFEGTYSEFADMLQLLRWLPVQHLPSKSFCCINTLLVTHFSAVVHVPHQG